MNIKLSITSLFLTACLPLNAWSQLSNEITFSAETERLPESRGTTKVKILRSDATRPGVFNIMIDGDAIPGKDYRLGTEGEYNNQSISVLMSPGKHFTELEVVVLDDVSAESDETIELNLLTGDTGFDDSENSRVSIVIEANDFTVTSVNDSGEGTLRQAIRNANNFPGLDTVSFSSEHGPFGPPREILLESSLPEITDDLILDGYIEGFLWQPAGVIVSGDYSHQVISNGVGIRLEVLDITISNGRSEKGGGIFNRGELIVKGVTMEGNQASMDGGAVFNEGGTMYLINSTLVENTASNRGGALANVGGFLTITNSTLTENRAQEGGAVFSDGTIRLSNSILANSGSVEDCLVTEESDTAGTHNLVEVNRNCPGVFFEDDPKLTPRKYFNGMTKTFPLGGLSLARNSGSNEAALDEYGEPLRWDQRGNGDPRVVAGYTDIGAFETQAFPKFVVDTLEDNQQQGCGGTRGDCPLRAAIRLANAIGKDVQITFDRYVFKEVRRLELKRPIPTPGVRVTLDAGETPGIQVLLVGGGNPVEPEDMQMYSLTGVTFGEN